MNMYRGSKVALQVVCVGMTAMLILASFSRSALAQSVCDPVSCPGATAPSAVTLLPPPEKSSVPYGRHIWPDGVYDPIRGYVNFSWRDVASWGTDCEGDPSPKGVFNYTVKLFPGAPLVSQKLNLAPTSSGGVYLVRDYSAVGWLLSRAYIWDLQAVNRVDSDGDGDIDCVVEGAWSRQNFNYWCKQPAPICPSGQTINAPTLTSPADGSYVSPSHIEFDWDALSEDDWGIGSINGASYDEFRNDEGLTGNCYLEEVEEDAYRYYDVLIAPTAGLSLPGDVVCDDCYTSVTDSFTYDIGDPGVVPLTPGVQYTWAVRGVNPGTVDPSFTPCPIYGEWSTRTFMTDHPPVITDIEVIETDLPCTLPGSTEVSHWTGSAFSNQIIVKLVTLPFNSADTFSFIASGSGYVDFVLRGDEAPNSQTVLAGTYGVEQDIPSGWEQTSAVCENTATNEGVSPDTIVVETGDIILCTFTNSRLVSSAPLSDNAMYASLVGKVSAEEEVVLTAQTDTESRQLQNESESVSPYAAVIGAGVTGITNNPISIKVTVTDEDGWEDIDKVWLDIRNTSAPDYCDNEQMQYVAIGVSGTTAWAECPDGPDGTCSYASPSACNGAIGCLWDYGSSECLRGSCHNCTDDYDVENYSYSYSEVHSGSTREFTFVITFKDSYPQGIQQIYAMAYDGALFSGGSGGGFTPSRTTFADARWGFDFHAPGGNITLYHPAEGSVTATTLGIRSTIDDALSGVKRVYDRMYWITGSGSGVYPLLDYYYNAGLTTGLEDDRELSGTGEESFDVPFGDISGGDNVHARDTREDLACNVGDTLSGVFAVGLPWVETFGGSVYSLLGYYDPIPSVGRALSEYWLGSFGTERFFNSPGQPSLQDPYWYSEEYSDNNLNSEREVPWYDELYSLAQASHWWVDQDNEMQLLDVCDDPLAVNAAVNDPAQQGIFEAVTGDVPPSCSHEIVLDGSVDTCQGTKIIFIPSGIDLTIHPDFLEGDDSSCLFVVEEGTVTIEEGSDKDGPEVFDRVDASIISQGSLVLAPDTTYPRPDRLELFGFFYSDLTDFHGRDMIWEDNMLYPTVKITYDPGAMTLFREALGRRVYSEIECGIVRDTWGCLDWYERDEEDLP